MEDKRELMEYLFQVVGEEGCGVSCDDAEIFQDQEGWKLMLCGFLEPWLLGKTVEEAKSRIKEYASQGFGLGRLP
ncbi:MAG: hypothetical protein AB1512_04330 [Thermodesulfobacteriota bacterium]